MRIKEYRKEPFDLHLFILLLLKKIWILLLAGIVGGLLFGGIYYLQNITFGPADTYEMISELHMEYAVDEAGEKQVAFNQVTWGTMIDCDDIMLPIVEATGYKREVLTKAVSATLLSDTRILTTTVEGFDKEMVEKINPALLSSLQEFGENQTEFVEIRPMLEPDEARVKEQDTRVLNATVLGVVLGVCVSLLIVMLYILWDDRIHISEIFENRYQLPVLGIYGTDLYKKNSENLLNKEKEHIAVFVDEGIDCSKFDDRQYQKMMENPYLQAEKIEELSTDAEYIIFVSAKRHNSKLLQALFSLFEKYGCDVVAGVLIESNEKLQKMYYVPGKKWIEKHLK